ncbi:MAG: 3-methyladenine DNA glycosylase [Cellulomonadaceae bacterium]
MLDDRQNRAQVTSPGPCAALLEPEEWQPLATAHAERADALTAGWTTRRAAGEKHAVEDFLFTYYQTRPGQLRRWHPGVGIELAIAPETELATGPEDDRRTWRWYRTTTRGVVLDAEGLLTERQDTVRYVRDLLTRTAMRPTNVGCFGLHEWAMVYQRGDDARHPLPLRLGARGTDAVVESQQIRCSHFDAFRFFTPEARPRNALQPTRETQPDLEQPGCLHATMDLYKWVTKLGPAAPGELVLDCFALAMNVRRLDMQASPYDVSRFGLPAVTIETPEGRSEYSRRQRRFAERAAPLREQIVAVCNALLGAGHVDHGDAGEPDTRRREAREREDVERGAE